MRVISLYDTTGYAVEPFTKRGAETYIIDILNVGERAVNPRATHVLHWDIKEKVAEIILLKPNLILAFPPCTDLSVAGARHFEAKRQANKYFQQDAIALAYAVIEIGNAAGCPWFFENPNSRISTIYRKPDITFHPYEYGGYLPEWDEHPEWPKYIAPRDAYKKLTNYWTGNNFRLNVKKPVPFIQHSKGFNTQTGSLGGKSLKTKMIRSASPRGVFEGLAQLWYK